MNKIQFKRKFRQNYAKLRKTFKLRECKQFPIIFINILTFDYIRNEFETFTYYNNISEMKEVRNDWDCKNTKYIWYNPKQDRISTRKSIQAPCNLREST